jgi:hypothetical protein
LLGWAAVSIKLFNLCLESIIKAFKSGLLLLLTWLSIYRAGEAAKSSWKGMWYDFQKWKLLEFCCICSRRRTWFWLDLSWSGKAFTAKCLTNILKELQKDDRSGISLRKGSVLFLAYHPEFENLISGWSNEKHKYIFSLYVKAC